MKTTSQKQSPQIKMKLITGLLATTTATIIFYFVFGIL